MLAYLYLSFTKRILLELTYKQNESGYFTFIVTHSVTNSLFDAHTFLQKPIFLACRIVGMWHKKWINQSKAIPVILEVGNTAIDSQVVT